MTIEEEPAREKLVAYLRMGARKNVPISDATEIYYDLGLYGDDIFDLVVWAKKELGIAFPLELKKYAPAETNFFRIRRWLQRTIGEEPRYQSFTVRLVLDAAKQGRWP
jgi:hypothetical protein